MLVLLWQQLRKALALFYNNAVICLVKECYKWFIWEVSPIIDKTISLRRAAVLGLVLNYLPAIYENINTIFEYDITSDSFTEIGSMIRRRSYHAITQIQYKDFDQWCQ